MLGETRFHSVDFSFFLHTIHLASFLLRHSSRATRTCIDLVQHLKGPYFLAQRKLQSPPTRPSPSDNTRSCCPPEELNMQLQL